ncbi:MAG: hypothetical protein D6704_08490, partial [Nitrospirae bacterium]
MLIDRGFDKHENSTTQDLERTIYEELGELAKYVEATTRAIREMEAPVAASADQLPKANDFLTDLSRMTEEGTHQVMSLTDAIQENHEHIEALLKDVPELLASGNPDEARAKVEKALALLAEDQSRLVDISVALSFQDLVAQRVKKLVTILEDVQHKLLKLVVIFGLQQERPAASQDGKGYEMLKQLEKSKTSALDQTLVD